jgi:hypothetical protein
VARREAGETFGVRLGKLPASTDHRTLKAAKYLDLEQLPTGPTNLTRGVHQWPMYANDRIGDCGPASCGHMIQAWTAADGLLIVPSPNSVISFYSTVSGFDPARGMNESNPTDVGVNMLDMLNVWRRKGIGGRKILAYVKVDIANKREAQAASFLFGGLSMGYELPEYVQGLSRWYMGDRKRGDDTPGSWGGHAVNRVVHSARTKKNVSWGGLMPVTYEFDREYSDECYAVLSEDWTGGDRKAPNGFALDELLSDLAKVTG